jgi:predicted phosphodiesterase
VISDVHANLQALEAVMKDLAKIGCVETICLGDTVGYGADPEDCVDIVRSSCSRVVVGNHDLAASGTWMDMSDLARISIDYTMKKISTRTIKWLQSLPKTEEMKFGAQRAVFAHGSYPFDITFPYLLYAHVVKSTISSMVRDDFEIGFFGHTHYIIHGHRAKNGVENSVITDGMFGVKSTSKLKRGHAHVLNIGSVGQPRGEHDWRANYVVVEYDDDAVIKVDVRKVEYDVVKARDRIIESGLPAYNGDRLLQGFKER